MLQNWMSVRCSDHRLCPSTSAFAKHLVILFWQQEKERNIYSEPDSTSCCSSSSNSWYKAAIKSELWRMVLAYVFTSWSESAWKQKDRRCQSLNIKSSMKQTLFWAILTKRTTRKSQGWGERGYLRGEWFSFALLKPTPIVGTLYKSKCLHMRDASLTSMVPVFPASIPSVQDKIVLQSKSDPMSTKCKLKAIVKASISKACMILWCCLAKSAPNESYGGGCQFTKPFTSCWCNFLASGVYCLGREGASANNDNNNTFMTPWGHPFYRAA